MELYVIDECKYCHDIAIACLEDIFLTSVANWSVGLGPSSRHHGGVIWENGKLKEFWFDVRRQTKPKTDFQINQQFIRIVLQPKPSKNETR